MPNPESWVFLGGLGDSAANLTVECAELWPTGLWDNLPVSYQLFAVSRQPNPSRRVRRILKADC
jgi:hypothetical protein